MLKVRGLTLVELMVVVAVLAVLAGIAYPLYNTQTQKARRADAKTVLENIALAQERFYTINGRYSDDYSELYTGTVAAVAAGLDWPCGSATNCGTPRGYYNVTIRHVVNDQDFQVEADKAGAQSADSCTDFRLDQLGQKSASGGTNCW